MINTQAEISENFNKVADDYNKLNHNHYFIDQYAFFKSIIPGKKVVDLGCGAGRDAEFFIKDGYDYLGINSSKGMVLAAQNRIKNGQFKIMDLRNLKLPLDSFDGFWASASLLSVSREELPAILKSFYNILKKGGVGFVSVEEKRRLGESPVIEIKDNCTEHCFYIEEEFSKLLREAGFTIVKHMSFLEEAPSDIRWLSCFVRKD